MPKTLSYSLEQLASIAGCRIIGDASCQIYTLASLQGATQNQMSFLSDAKMREALKATKASAVILSEKNLEFCPCAALVTDNPQLAFAKIAQHYEYKAVSAVGIHASAVIAASARVDASASIAAHVVIGERCVIGQNVIIAAGCVISDDVIIGDGSSLYAHVSIYHGVIIGKAATIHAGVVIGSDGFGNVLDANNHWISVPQLGAVVIGDDVSIGANTTIDRGALGDTLIDDGVRLDNQIQIAHNVHIGAHTAVAGCVGIAGSADIGKHCMIGGGACIGGHISIADGVMVTGMSMVTRSIAERGIYSSGTGLQTNKDWHKSVVRFRQLDDMAKRLKRLENKVRD